MSDLTTSSGEPMASEMGFAEELVAGARAEGVELVGTGGLLTDPTKTVLGTALEVEIPTLLRGFAAGRLVGRLQ